MLNFEADFLVQVMEENLHMEFDVEKVEKFKGSRDIMDFSTKEDFFEEYFNLKQKSWGEMYDFIKGILEIDNYSYDDNILNTILKNTSLGNTSVYECLYRFEYEGGCMIVFISPGVLDACIKEKEIKLVGRMNSDDPFVDKAYELYNSEMYGGLDFNEFKNAVLNGSIIVFDNKKNFINWYLDDYQDYKEILDRLRNIESLDKENYNIDDYIINVLLKGNVIEFKNCVIADFEL